MLQDRSRRPVASEISTIAAVIGFLLVAGVLAWLKVGADGYYVLTPGNAPVVTASAHCRPIGGGEFALPGGKPCVQLVVPAGRGHEGEGSIMMVDVEQGKANIGQYLLYRLHILSWFGIHAEFLSNRQLLGNLPASQLSCQDAQQAYQATSDAPVAALRRLGYQVKVEQLGVLVNAVFPGTPGAAAGLECDDLITGINGRALHTAPELSAALHLVPAGTVVRLSVTRTVTGSGPPASRKLQFTIPLEPLPGTKTQPPNPKQGFIGIGTETRTSYDFPFPVSAEVGSIGGPSDGLALALGFINTLTNGHLTGNLNVAATGEIDPSGTVYAIGGAAEKAIAVRRAGATVFLVPMDNLAAARRTAGSMKVFGVSTLDQALTILKSLGGQVPPPVVVR